METPEEKRYLNTVDDAKELMDRFCFDKGKILVKK